MISFLSLNIPDGIIFFVQSYAYLETIYDYLLKNQYFSSILPFKKLHFDIKSSSANKDIFKEYSEDIKQNMGAMLFTVIGGKLSEGINFSDGLARAVVIIGLPYANYTDVELKEKMKYLDKNAEQKRQENHKTEEIIDGKIYYENLCIKAVNQSIGRAIRHKNDYALAFLIDARFSNDNIKSKLPGWVKKRVQVSDTIYKLESEIKQFFRNHKK